MSTSGNITGLGIESLRVRISVRQTASECQHFFFLSSVAVGPVKGFISNGFMMMAIMILYSVVTCMSLWSLVLVVFSLSFRLLMSLI